jgi:hypothetical protein
MERSGMKFRASGLLLTIISVIAVFSTKGYAQDDDHSGHTVGGELKHGRYVGYILFDDTNEKLAVVSDFYVESPEDLRLFPRLNALFKVSFGGYNTHEYFTETFEDIRYDFDNGVLTLDEPSNDILATAQVHTMGSDRFIIGQVFIRSSAVSGTLHLQFETDEPGGFDEPGDGNDDEPGSDGDDEPFIPLLEGQYEGQCDSERAAIQIQTVRGLATPEARNDLQGLSREYGIAARLAYKNSALCGANDSIWCTYRQFSAASYNPYLGKIAFQGENTSQDCSLRQGKLVCRVPMRDHVQECVLQKVDMRIQPVIFASRAYNVRATSDQMRELPPASPPHNTELTAALRGTFSGYLHNETNDTYQVIRLNVMPYSSTDNPHNPNQMMVTTTAINHFDRGSGGDFVTQRYEPRSFYLRPGFTLNGPSSDTYISVVDWRTGFIRGVMYSHAFGRIGTVQLIKGALPDIPAAAKIVRNFVGEFEGSLLDDNGSVSGSRWFKLIFPAQPTDLRESLVRFKGNFVSIVDVTTIESIQEGTYDPYTGRFGWMITREATYTTLVSGLVDSEAGIRAFWPPAPNVFGVRTKDYAFEAFRRLR